MKVTKRVEEEFEDIPDEDQLSIIKSRLFEFAGRVVAALGVGVLGLYWGVYVDHTQPVVVDGQVQPPMTTGEVVLSTLFFLGVAGFIGYSAYKERKRILDYVSAIQGDEARDCDES